MRERCKTRRIESLRRCSPADPVESITDSSRSDCTATIGLEAAICAGSSSGIIPLNRWFQQAGRDWREAELRRQSSEVHALFVSTVDAAFSYHRPNHAIWFPSNSAGSFPSLVSESLRSTRWECPASGGSDPGPVGWGKGSAHGLRGHLQLSAPRRAADSGGFAAGKRPWHSRVSGGSHYRGNDGKRSV